MLTSITKELMGTKMTEICSLGWWWSNNAASQETLKIVFDKILLNVPIY